MSKLKISIIAGAAVIIGLLILILFWGDIHFKSKENEGIEYLIGVSQPNLMDPWYIAMNDEIKTEANAYPDLKIIFYDAGQDPIKQKRDIENMVKQEIDLLIVSPSNGEFLSETVEKVYNIGIPVIVMENPIETEYYTMRIYSDNYEIGRQAAQYAKKLLGNDGGTILEVQGDPNSRVSCERKEGFRTEIGKNSGFEVRYTVVGYWSRDKTEERVREIYQKEPEVDLVFAHSDAMAIGAWRVASYKGIEARFIGIGGLSGKGGGIEAVNNGILEASFIYPTGGREALEYAVMILNGESVPKTYMLPTIRVTRDNVQSFLLR